MGRGTVSRWTLTEIYHFETNSKLMAYFCLLMHAAQSTERCHLWQEWDGISKLTVERISFSSVHLSYFSEIVLALHYFSCFFS
jgi:hypothetical protein